MKLFTSLIFACGLALAHGDVFLQTGFEGSSSLPAGWTQTQISGGATWAIQQGGHTGGSNPTAAHSGTNNATLYVTSSTENKTQLLSPTFSTTGFTNLSLTFWHTQELWSPDQDELKVFYSSDGGSNWTELAYYTDSVATWTKRTLIIPSGSANSRIMFEGNAKYGHGVCLDDIQVEAPPEGGYDLNILVIGSTHSYSEGGESGAVHEAAYNPTTIASNLKSMLLADPANTGTVNVSFEDVYRTSLQPVIGGGNSNTVYTEANATWMTFECLSLAQYFMWPDGKATRMANLRGQAGTNWDYIVIVEDPYVLANFPGMYAQAAKLYHEEISKGTAQLVLMSQWPQAGSSFTATAFNEHSFRVGDSLGVKVAPAAKAWNDLTSKDTSANHPTPNGAYLAAASLYSTLTTRNATSFVTGASNQSLTQLAYNTLQTTNSTTQYSSIYTNSNKFQMKYSRNRLFVGSQQGTSTENGIWYRGILPAANASGVSFTIPLITAVGPLPIDFNLGRGYLGTEKYYIVDPAKYSRSYGFPTGDNSQTKGAETMRYGIDKRNVSGSYDQNTDLGIAYNMLRQGEVEPSYDVRAIPMRLLWSQLYHYHSEIPAYRDLWHLSDPVNRAAGSFIFTLNTGRCPVGDEPANSSSTEWQNWFAQKVGYETAWQMSHMNARAPGFRVIPTADKPETGYVVTPSFSQGLSVRFINPPVSNVTVAVSVDDAAAGAVSTSSLTFTPLNYNVPQIVNVTGVSRENGEFPFKVILTTSSNDIVYHGHQDEWDFKNNVVAAAGSVLIGGWEGPRPFTPDQAIVSDALPKRLSDTPLQSPTLEDRVTAVLSVDNGAILGSSGVINHPANQRYLWGSADLDVKPNDVTSTIVYRSGAPHVLTLTITNTHPTKDLRLDAIHWIISRTSDAPTQVAVSYASGNLSDTPGASTVVTLTTGAQHNTNLSTFLSDRVLFRGESATFTWTPDPAQFTGANPTLSVDNFAISGNLIPSASPNQDPVVDAGTDQVIAYSTVTSWTPGMTATAAWFDASDGSTLWADNGTTPATATVQRWDDKSGNNKHAVANGSKPTYTSGTSSVSGTALTPMTLPNDIYAGATSGCLVWVGKQDTGGGGWGNYGANNNIHSPWTSNYFYSAFLSTSRAAATTATPGLLGAQTIQSRVQTGTNLEMWSNGTQIYNGAQTFNNSPSETKFFDYNDYTLNELVFLPNDDVATRQKVEGYLAHKWGMATSLPAGHPYKNAAPTVTVASGSLNGNVTDADGPTMNAQWSKVSGPGNVTFGNTSALNTTAGFTTPGTYTLKLTANDSYASGEDTVTIQVVLPVTYTNWIGGTFANPFTNTTLTGNPDGDALTNLQEYAFGLDPTSPINQPLSYVVGDALSQTGVPELVYDGSNYLAVFARRKDHLSIGLSYTVEFSADLAIWTVAGASPSRLTSVTDLSDYEAVSVPYPAQVSVSGGGAQQTPKFFRVSVQSN